MMLTSKLPDDASTLYMTLPSGTDPHAAPAGTESSGDEDMYKDPSPTESRASTKKRKKDKPPSDPDGYSFRKYGKKMIGDEARHYYRCTFPGWDAKRHITYQSDGPCITNLGSHSHEPPAPTAAERKKKRVKTMSSRASAMVFLNSSKSFVDAVRGFEDRCEDDDEEMKLRLGPDVDYTEDGQVWLLRGKNTSGEDDDMRFECSSQMCNASKRVQTRENGIFVTYRGPHSHDVPLIAPRSWESGAASEENSGSHGSLHDVP